MKNSTSNRKRALERPQCSTYCCSTSGAYPRTTCRSVLAITIAIAPGQNANELVCGACRPADLYYLRLYYFLWRIPIATHTSDERECARNAPCLR
eukprot:1174341-Prorocentrum_minimum.AAC.4